MPITTLDALIAGMQAPVEFAKVGAGTQVVGRIYSPFYVAGSPGAAPVPTPGMAGAALTSYAGQLPFVTNLTAGVDEYLARFAAQCNAVGTLLLADRLWHNSGIGVTVTGAQAINSVAFPPRDAVGSANGERILVGLELSTATGTGASVISISYTNQAGASGRTGNPRVPYAASSIAGSFYDFMLAEGDTGVRSIQSYTSTVSMSSGAVHLVAYRVLARLGIPLASVDHAIDALTAGMPRLFDNSVPFLLWVPGATVAPSNIQGQFIQSNG